MGVGPWAGTNFDLAMENGTTGMEFRCLITMVGGRASHSMRFGDDLTAIRLEAAGEMAKPEVTGVQFIISRSAPDGSLQAYSEAFDSSGERVAFVQEYRKGVLDKIRPRGSRKPASTPEPLPPPPKARWADLTFDEFVQEHVLDDFADLRFGGNWMYLPSHRRTLHHGSPSGVPGDTSAVSSFDAAAGLAGGVSECDYVAIRFASGPFMKIAAWDRTTGERRAYQFPWRKPLFGSRRATGPVEPLPEPPSI